MKYNLYVKVIKEALECLEFIESFWVTIPNKEEKIIQKKLLNQIGRVLAKEPLKVVVEVRGGTAYLAKCPKGVSVEIVDLDNRDVGEDV